MKYLKNFNENKSSLSTDKEYSEADLDKLLQFISDEEAHGQDVDMLFGQLLERKCYTFSKKN